MRKYLPVVGLLFVVMLAGPVAANDEIAALEKTMTGAAAKLDPAATYAAAAQIVETAGKLAPEALTAPDLFAVGLARHYLAAEALEKAEEMGGLPAADLARAKAIVLQVWPPPAESKVRVIGHGEKINLPDYLTPGKTTIVDFYSEYCYPCTQLGPRIEALVGQRDDLMLVKVDLNRPGVVGIDWQSPAARQFNLDGIPHLKIYGPDGKLQAEGRPALDNILQWCEQQ